MNSFYSSANQNTTSFVRPQLFFINGFADIPFTNYYLIFLAFIYVVSVFGNSFVIFIIYTNRSLHIPKFFGIFNLAIADFGETNALIPNLIKTFLFQSKYISYEACLANMFFVFFFSTVQSLTLVVMAYDRFVAICLPLRYHTIISNTIMAAMFTGIWVFNTILVSLTVSLITRISFCKTIVINSYFCDHGPIYRMACNDNTINSIMAKLNTVLYLHAPLLAIVLSYAGILLALCKITTWQGRLKALKTCVADLVLVAVFFLPIICTYIAALTFSLHPNARIISTSLALAIPPVLNPVIYILNTAEVKDFIKRGFKRSNSITARVNVSF